MTENEDQTNQPDHPDRGDNQELHEPVAGGTVDVIEGKGGSILTRRSFVRIAGVATVGGAVALLATRPDEEEAVQVGAVQVGFVEGAMPEEPRDAVWASRAPLIVPLSAQNLTAPMLDQATIFEVGLRVLHNGDEIAFHLEWDDETVQDLEAIARFRDAVAVQLPVKTNEITPITMGGPGAPVHILHWKASWQRQVDTGPRQVRDAFPNAINEVTPEDMMGEEAANVFYPALYVGNLAATRDRLSAVEELVAEGFGTLTTHDIQRAQGRGLFSDGRWQVVIRVPMEGDDTQATIRPGEATQVALAAWDGGQDNRGGRKHWSNWVAMEVESIP